MSSLLRDLRYSLRGFRKSPGFVIVAVLAVAFGIAVNSAVFTLLNAIALRPPPVREPSDVVTIYQRIQTRAPRHVHGDQSFFSNAEFDALRSQNSSFSGLVAYAGENLTMGGTNAQPLRGQLVTCDYFQVLAGPMTLGRPFAAEECTPAGAMPIVVLSHLFWQRAFASDPAIVGKTIPLNGRTFTVIGVGPEGFRGASFMSTDLWGPMSVQEQFVPDRQLTTDPILSWLEVSGRLKPGVSLAQARADLAVIAARIDQQSPPRTTTVFVDRATLMNNPRQRPYVLTVGAVVLSAVSLILLIVCANLANLLLARAAFRRKEIAVRLAVGASRVRLLRQLMAESLLLSVTGGALGVAAAFVLLRTLIPALAAQLPRDASYVFLNLTPDVRILLYAVLVSFATGLGFGLLPALQASRVDLNSALKDAGALAGGVSRRWLRGALVGTQVAVCLILLIGAGLMVRGLYAAQTIDPGFAMKNVTVAGFDLELEGYDRPRSEAFHRSLAERIAALPGVERVAQADPVPLSTGRHGDSIRVEGSEQERFILLTTVSADYFDLLQVPILRGRAFEERDIRSDTQVAIVSEAAARSFWPDQNPVGKRFRRGASNSLTEVIGVAKDIHSVGLTDADPPFLYFPLQPLGYRRMQLLVKSSMAYATMASAIHDAALAMDPPVLVTATRLEDNLDRWQFPSRVVATLGLVLGFAGLLISSLGIYGVVSYAVSQRTKEIGIRMSLGAQKNDVLGMILQQSLRPVLIGVAAGLVGCAAVSRVLSSLLFGVSPLDPLVFASVSIFLAAVAVAASYVPALRASRVDPLHALRHE